MTQNTTYQSGTFNIPPLLKAPTTIDLDSAPEIKGVFCYIIRHYGNAGISAMIVRRRVKNDVEVHVVLGDWNGTPLKLDGTDSGLGQMVMATYIGKLAHAMKLIKIDLAQFYFVFDGTGLCLVDMQTATNKLVGPGMVRDMFGNILPVQQTLKIEVVDDRVLGMIKDNSGTYAGSIIIKPSKFRTVERQSGTRPLYVEVKR